MDPFSQHHGSSLALVSFRGQVPHIFHPLVCLFPSLFHFLRPVLLVFILLPINRRDVLKVIHRSPIPPRIDVLR